jgi:hypothetical protein
MKMYSVWVAEKSYRDYSIEKHAAWYSEESQEELQMRTALEAVRVLRGEKPHNIVNPDVLDTRDAVRFYFPRSSSISARYCKRSC